jgi:hypothetical protein
MAVRRRLRQFCAAIAAHVTADERALVARLLSPGELRLFERMPRFDQRHCLDVYHTLVRSGYTDPLLLRAALIHDCGKVDDAGRPIPLVYYGIFVIVQKVAPALYRWAAQHECGPLRPFAIHAAHDTRSALLAEAAGCPPALVAILRDYATRRMTEHTTALAWADEQN